MCGNFDEYFRPMAQGGQGGRIEHRWFGHDDNDVLVVSEFGEQSGLNDDGLGGSLAVEAGLSEIGMQDTDVLLPPMEGRAQGEWSCDGGD